MVGQFIANFESGGGVKYVIDPRYHHDELIGLLMRFQEIAEAELARRAVGDLDHSRHLAHTENV